MSNESKQLATNGLDEQKDTSTFGLVSLIFIGAAILVIMLGLMTGSFKVSITDGVSINKDILVPSIITNIDKFEKVEIAETIVKGMVVPIEETQKESLKALLGDQYSEEVYFEDEDSFCKADDKTPAEIIEILGSCRYFSSLELDAGSYVVIKSRLNFDCPSLRPYTQELMGADRKITYIEKNKFDAKCDSILVITEKQKLLDEIKKLKQELLE